MFAINEYATRVTVPLSADTVVKVIAGEEPRAMYVWENGERTDKPVTDSRGRSLYRFRTQVLIDGAKLSEASVEIPQAVIPGAEQFGAVLVLEDPELLTISAPNRGEFGLRFAVRGGGLSSAINLFDGDEDDDLVSAA